MRINKIFVYIRMETEKEIEYKSTIMEMRNIIKNQERVIEELMLKILNIKIYPYRNATICVRDFNDLRQ